MCYYSFVGRLCMVCMWPALYGLYVAGYAWSVCGLQYVSCCSWPGIGSLGIEIIRVLIISVWTCVNIALDSYTILLVNDIIWLVIITVWTCVNIALDSYTILLVILQYVACFRWSAVRSPFFVACCPWHSISGLLSVACFPWPAFRGLLLYWDWNY